MVLHQLCLSDLSGTLPDSLYIFGGTFPSDISVVTTVKWEPLEPKLDVLNSDCPESTNPERQKNRWPRVQTRQDGN
jgi:hypothetical protein